MSVDPKAYVEHAKDKEIDRLRVQVGMLRSENAKLRGRVAELEELLPDSGRWYRAETVEAYVAKIAKLRELCGFMLRCMKRNHDCDCCLVNGEHCGISYIESDARELEVEVEI